MHKPIAPAETVFLSRERDTLPKVGDALAERYHLQGDAGTTEAGIVFDAVDRMLDRRVAVELATSIVEPKALRKWARDAMLAQRLEGAHVLRIFEVGSFEMRIPFIVRETAFCTLASELDARGPQPIPQAVAWSLDVCEALAEAHALGMAHGDLRLENVYLVADVREPSVKVSFTSAAKAERAAREDVARDIAAVGAMLRLLTTGHTELGTEGAQTLPGELASAVARALAADTEWGFKNIAELAGAIAPFAPTGHTAAPTVAAWSAGAPGVGRAIVGRTIVESDPDMANIAEAWFGAAREPLRSQLETAARPMPPARNNRGAAFALVSFGLIAAMLIGSWFLWQNGGLPRWTGAAPPEEVGTTRVTSAPAPAAAAEPQAPDTLPSMPVDSLPNVTAVAPAPQAASSPTAAEAPAVPKRRVPAMAPVPRRTRAPAPAATSGEPEAAPAVDSEPATPPTPTPEPTPEPTPSPDANDPRPGF